MSRQLAQGGKRPPRLPGLQQMAMKQCHWSYQHKEKKNTNMKRWKRSPVWEYLKLKMTSCKISDAVLKYNNSTSLWMYHIRCTYPARSSGRQKPEIPTVLAMRENTCDEARVDEITQRNCHRVAKDMMPISPVHNLACNKMELWSHKGWPGE